MMMKPMTGTKSTLETIEQEDDLATRARQYVNSLNRKELYCFDLQFFARQELERTKQKRQDER